MSAPSRSRSREKTPSEKSSLGKVQLIVQAPVAEQEEAVSGPSGTPVDSGLPSAEGRNAADHYDSSGRSAPSSADANQERSMVTPPSSSPAPGTTMPLVPAIPVPARTKVVVTVPVKMKVPPQASLQDVRKKLIAAGIPVESSKGSFHCRGEPEVIDDVVVGDLQDTRLAFFPEADLQPWQLCAAHRACERLVQRLGQNWAATRHPFYKTRLCNNWVQQGGCLRGARCVYAHGPAELQRAQVPAGFMPRPPGPSQAGGVKMPPVKVPEVVFTVDKEEERRRAERAKRFAPRAASFEAKEAPPQKSEDAPEEVDIDEVDPEVGFINEEQIAEYLMEMQQQLDVGFDVDGAQGAQRDGEMCDGIPEEAAAS